METLFGNHPFGRRILGTRESVSSITREDLVSLHSRLYSPANLVVTVVTDVPAEEVVKEFGEALGGNWGSGESFPGYAAPEPLSETRKKVVEEGMKQAYIYMGYLLPGALDEDVPAIMTANSILSARLGLTLREKEGLAYSVGSGVRFDRNFGYLVISMGTGAESVDEGVAGIKDQIEELVEKGITERELSRAVNDYRGDLLRKRMSRLNKAYYMARDEYLGWEGEDALYEKMRELTVEDVSEVAGKYLSTDSYVLVVVK